MSPSNQVPTDHITARVIPRVDGTGFDEDDTSFLSFMLDKAPTRASVRKWPQELKAQRKMELHSKRMARFRNRKASQLQSMQAEHRRLEEELERRVDRLHRSEVCGVPQVQNEMQRLVLEREVLRQESIELRQKIAHYLKFQQLIQTSSEKLVSQMPSNVLTNSDSDSAGTFTVRCVESEWKPVKEQAGRRVDFPGGEPSFFFHPFSRHEFDEVLSSQQQKFTGEGGNLTHAGKFLGWEVFHAPLVSSQRSESLLGWTRYSKRVQSSVEKIQSAMSRPDGSNVWPILSSARSLGCTEDITGQTLQQLDVDSRVIVRSYPGKVCFRFLGLVQCAKWQEVNGKRVLTYSFVIADSEANARSRSAEPGVHQNVRWVQEGGAFLTLTEVDGGVVDAQFNHWTSCSSELQARSLFITFGHLVTRWEQFVSPSKFLTL